MYTKTYIYIVYQNLDLYHIGKLRLYDINLGFDIRYESRF
jgi:hypothetical protein